MNKCTTKFVDKSTHLCRTIVDKAGTYIAALINSIEYEKYFSTLFDLLTLDYNDDIMAINHQQLDKNKKWRQRYGSQPYVQRCEAKIWALKIQENIRREYVDKKAGKSYGLGCNDPSQKALGKTNNCKSGEEKRPCSHCGKLGHTTTRSQHCTFTTYKPKKKEGKFCLASVPFPM